MVDLRAPQRNYFFRCAILRNGHDVALMSRGVQSSKWMNLDLKTLKERNNWSFAKMADLLRPYEDFATLQASTVKRWIDGGATSASANRALELLSAVEASIGQDKGLTVAFPQNNVWMLPIQLAMNTDHVATKSLRGERPITAKSAQVDVGRNALDDLANGTVDIAVAATVLIEENEAKLHIRRLCSIAQANIVSMELDPPKSSTKRQPVIGYPDGSALGTILTSSGRNRSARIDWGRMRPIGNPAAKDHEAEQSRREKTAADYLIKGEIDVLLWWQPAIDHIAALVEQRGHKTTLSSDGRYGSVEVSLAVRRESVNLPGIRWFLAALEQSISYINRPQAPQDSSWKNWLRDQYPQIDSDDDLESALRGCDYRLTNWDVPTLLALWKREVGDALAAR